MARVCIRTVPGLQEQRRRGPFGGERRGHRLRVAVDAGREVHSHEKRPEHPHLISWNRGGGKKGAR